jgi:Domain of unknown function (DUF2804), N-terminal/Domain of unknown function (DUF2804), C-terminal
MREIVEPVDLCDADGTLSPAAIGWSRRPLHRCNLGRRWRKRWDWWCVTDGRWYLILCAADIDYLAGGVVSLLDLSTGEKYERLVPLGCPLPETVSGSRFHRLGMKMDLLPHRLSVSVGKISAEFELAPSGDSLSTVVPWSRDQFWYTSKHVGIPARGTLRWGDRVIDIDGWAALDFGRGRWPARARWNWGVAVGGGVAFNLGGRWTDGTGATENGLFVDGKLRKIQDPVTWEPGWRLRSPDVELDFQPMFERRLGWPPRFGLHWCAGHYQGRVLDRKIDRLFGWAEALDILW